MSVRTVVVTQSNYLPWRGYFDSLRRADEVILLDSVQYTRRDWRNRNRIKTANGPAWITIPVEVTGRYDQAVDGTRIASAAWADAHRRSIEVAYRRAPAFADGFAWLSDRLADAARHERLTDVNEALLRAVSARLGITTSILRDVDLIPRASLAAMSPSERLIALATERGATRYLTGPAARAYLDLPLFEARGIEVAWMDYGGYPEYPQLHGPYEPALSILDPILNLGDAAARCMDRGP